MDQENGSGKDGGPDDGSDNEAGGNAPQMWVFLRLSRLRADKGIAKTTLASKASVAVNTINNAEKRKGNRYEPLMRVFNVLNDKEYYDGQLVAAELIKAK